LILLDTHVVIWLAASDSRLSKNAKDALAKARQNEEGLAISDMTFLEITNLWHRRRINLRVSFESFLNETERRFTVLPITPRVCVQSLALPSTYPKDPADRIIGATALIEGISLVTADQAIRQSKAVTTIW